MPQPGQGRPVRSLNGHSDGPDVSQASGMHAPIRKKIGTAVAGRSPSDSNRRNTPRNGSSGVVMGVIECDEEIVVMSASPILTAHPHRDPPLPISCRLRACAGPSVRRVLTDQLWMTIGVP